MMKKRIVGMVLALLLVGGVFGGCAWQGKGMDEKTPGVVQSGSLSQKGNLEQTEKKPQKKPEAVFAVHISSKLIFENGAKEPGLLRIENVAKNRNSCIVILRLKDTGEEIYRTPVLEPGQYIEEDALKTVVPDGEYPVEATFQVLAEDGSVRDDIVVDCELKIASVS